MAENDPLFQDDLPEWLRDDDGAADSGAPADDDAFDWLLDEDDAPGAAQPPAPGQIRGLTGPLPWEGGSPGDETPPPPGEAGDDFDWEDQIPSGDAGQGAEASPGRIRGLTGPLPWASDADDEAEAAEAQPGQFGDMSGDLPWFDEEVPAPTTERIPGLVRDAALPEDDADLDWLFARDEPPAAPEAAVPAADVPDWLAAGLGEAAVPDEAAPAARPADDVPDWLYAAGELEDDAFAIPPSPEAEVLPDSEPDWLIRDTGEYGGEPQDAQTYDEWVTQQEEAERQPDAEELLAQEVPDWFAGVEDAVPPPPAAPRDSGSLSADFVPDWYLGLEEQDTSAAPDWFGDLDFSPEALSAAPSIPEAPLPHTGDLDAALDFDFGAEAAASAGAAAGPVAGPDFAFDEDDFLADLGDAVEAGEADPFAAFGDLGAVPAPAAAPVEDAGFDFAPGDFDDPFADLDAPAAPADEFPDWFAQMGDGAPPAEPPAPPAPAAQARSPEPGDSPGWLDDLGIDGLDDLALGDFDLGDAEAIETDKLIQQGQDFDFMQMLGDVSPPGGRPLAAPGEADVLPDKLANFDLDAYLAEQSRALPDSGLLPADLPPDLAAGMPGGPPGGGAGEAMPDWLRQARPDSGPESFSAVNVALRQSEVPVEELADRLKALRTLTARVADDPPAALAAAESGDSLLAGVSGALAPALPLDEAVTPEMVLTFRPDAAQQKRVDVLQRLLGLEAAARTAESEVAYDESGQAIARDAREERRELALLARADRRARARVRRGDQTIRMGISAVILLALLLPFFVGAARIVQLPAAALDPATHGLLYERIEALRPGQMALVGFEYGPTAAGEMDALAEPLLRHILLSGGYPVVVSTSPAGTLQANGLLSRLGHDPALLAQMGRAPGDALTMPGDYVVLPYLPGGVVGLRTLSTLLSNEAALPLPIFSVDLQGATTGLDARQVHDRLALVLLLAERGDDVRQWIEQVQVVLGVDMAAAVTVAAEPIARPYVRQGESDTAALVGLLAGYRDAYSYDSALFAASGLAGIPADLPAETDELPGGAAESEQEDAPERRLLLQTTPTPQPDDGTPQPTPIPTRSFVTATPATGPASGGDAGAADGSESGAAASSGGAAASARVASRDLRDERWYSMGLGVLVIGGVIVLGTGVNIVRAMRRRRNQ